VPGQIQQLFRRSLRLAIITGVSKQNPAKYAVVVGPRLRHLEESENRVIMQVSRIHHMTPSTSANLQNFIAAYNIAGRFFLAPAWISASGELLGMPSEQLAIAKRQLDLREAWQIGDNDPDLMALERDDDPIVPAGVTDPPCNSALTRIREMAE